MLKNKIRKNGIIYWSEQENTFLIIYKGSKFMFKARPKHCVLPVEMLFWLINICIYQLYDVAYVPLQFYHSAHLHSGVSLQYET